MGKYFYHPFSQQQCIYNKLNNNTDDNNNNILLLYFMPTFIRTYAYCHSMTLILQISRIGGTTQAISSAELLLGWNFKGLQR